MTKKSMFFKYILSILALIYLVILLLYPQLKRPSLKRRFTKFDFIDPIATKPDNGNISKIEHNQYQPTMTDNKAIENEAGKNMKRTMTIHKTKIIRSFLNRTDSYPTRTFDYFTKGPYPCFSGYKNFGKSMSFSFS